MSNSDDSFLREVQEEVRREKLAKLFDQYGVMALAAVGVVAAAVIGYLWYGAYQTDVAQKAGARFAAAQRLLRSEEAKDKETALKDFQHIAATGPANYQALAKLQVAARMLDAGKLDEAKKAFQSVANAGEIKPEFSEYAKLQLIALEADGLELADLKKRLDPLMGADRPWRYSARELYAVKAVAGKEYDEARQVLGELLADQTVPPSIRQRSEMLMGLMATLSAAPAAIAGGAEAPKPDSASEEAQKPAPKSGETATESDTTPQTDDPKAASDTKKPDKPGTAGAQTQ